MTKHPELFAALAAPFDPEEVKARTQGGRQLHYVTARTVMNRLDNVLGPENWFDEYVPGEHSVLCRLTIRLPDGSLLGKADAGGYAGMADDGDDDKSGYSDAFKRAAVKFGVARYLYRDGVPSFVAAKDPETHHRGHGEHREEKTEVSRPQAPTNGHAKERTEWAGASDSRNAPSRTAAHEANGNGKHHDGPPKTGKALFAWTKDQEQRYEVSLLKYLNNWANLQEFPRRMVEWDSSQVALAYAEACRKLNSVKGDMQD